MVILIAPFYSTALLIFVDTGLNLRVGWSELCGSLSILFRITSCRWWLTLSSPGLSI